jgi:isopenicillin N synthase-like dioxygenase
VRLLGQAVGRTGKGGDLPDLAESLTFLCGGPTGADGADEALDNNIWPRFPPELRALVERYVRHACELTRRIMRLSALALDLPETWFDPYYAPMDCRLRLAYYPEQSVPPEPGQLRNAAHTDFGGVTILRQDDAPGGLQVLSPGGDWVDVRPVPGTLVINTGDIFQRWTNDRWMSNVHRVVNPPRAAGERAKRLSIVFFTGPRRDSLISCLPTCRSPARPPAYEPFIAGDLMRLRIAQTYG